MCRNGRAGASKPSIWPRQGSTGNGKPEADASISDQAPAARTTFPAAISAPDDRPDTRATPRGAGQRRDRRVGQDAGPQVDRRPDQGGSELGIVHLGVARREHAPQDRAGQERFQARTSVALSTFVARPDGRRRGRQLGGQVQRLGIDPDVQQAVAAELQTDARAGLDRGRPVGPERQARLGQGRQGRRIFTAQVGSEQTGCGPACSPSDPSPLDDGHRQPALGEGPRQGPADNAAPHHQHVGPTAHMMNHASAQGPGIPPYLTYTPAIGQTASSRPIGVDRRDAAT